MGRATEARMGDRPLCSWPATAPAQRPEPAPKHGGTLVFAVDAEPSNYDCQANVSFAFLHPVAPHYSTLLKFDTANYPQVIGDLAESWSVSPDKLTYSFRLRPEVLFHDGTPLTSADVKASYQRIAHPPAGVISARQVDYASISAIDTPDPLTVVFHLQWPDAAMLANFASPWNCIYQGAKLAADPQFPQDARARHRAVRVRRAREGPALDRPALGPLFSARPALISMATKPTS